MKIISTGHEQSRLTIKSQLELKRKIKPLYVNKDLIQFMETKIHDNAKKDKLAMLHYFKKLVQQVYRSPDPDHKAAFELEYEAEQLSIADEQAFYEPLKWINAEIEHINSQVERLSASDVDERLDIMQQVKERLSKPWLTSADVMEMFKCSNSTLKRRRAEGMPYYQKGKKHYYYLEEINEYMKH